MLGVVLGVVLVTCSLSGLHADEVACYGDLGCFPNDYPWRAFLRPFPEPQPPQEVNTTIFFSNRAVNRSLVVKTPELVIPQQYDNNKLTYFITHGFSSNSWSEWFKNLTEAILAKKDANIFIVDWKKGSSTDYFQAAANTRMVAAEISRVLRHLQKRFNLSPNKVHLFGHSLGAHIMAYVGKNISGIHRITAMDPAQPGFEGKNAQIRLNGSDAAFVDVVHTDGKPFLGLLGLGYTSGIGDVDFFVNGGKFQPNCALDGENFAYKRITDIPKITMTILYNLATCSHTRAPKYMAAAIKEDCHMWAYRYNASYASSRFENFIIDDTCDVENCQLMGLATDKFPAKGNFAFETLGEYPYCKYDPQAEQEMRRSIVSALHA